MFGAIFLLCLAAGSQQLRITDFAVPTAISAGENAELQCVYDLNDNESDKGLFVKWWWTPLHAESDRKKLIYQRRVGQKADTLQNYVNIKLGDNDTIVLQNLEPSDSGTYECEVSNIEEARKQQELIVYTHGTGPNMKIQTVADGPDEDTEEDVLVSCEANDVAPYPDLYITVNGEVFATSEMITNSTEGLYDISANATLSKDKAEGARISCELSYQTNITHPLYEDTKTYSSSEPTTTERPEVQTDGDVSTAAANTSQTAPGDKDSGVRSDSALGVLVSMATCVLLLQL